MRENKRERQRKKKHMQKRNVIHAKRTKRKVQHQRRTLTDREREQVRHASGICS